MANPEDCRENASRCLLMANQATDAHLRSVFFELAQAWSRLAEQLEVSQVIRDRRGHKIKAHQ
jgi:hypothetical protein